MNCYVSPIKTAGLLFLAVLMTAMSYFVGTQGSGQNAWLSWVGVLFFGLGIVILGRRLFIQSPVVIINGGGLTETRLGPNPITWEQIDAVSIGEIRAARFLCLWLKDEADFIRSLSDTQAALARANLAFGFPAVAISFEGITPGLDDAYAFVRKYVPERKVFS
jgi:hypothetical protein